MEQIYIMNNPGIKVRISNLVKVYNSDPSADLFLCLDAQVAEVKVTKSSEELCFEPSRFVENMSIEMKSLLSMFVDNHFRKLGLSKRELVLKNLENQYTPLFLGGCSFKYTGYPHRLPFPTYFLLVEIQDCDIPAPVNLGQFVYSLLLQDWTGLKQSLPQKLLSIPKLSNDDFFGVMYVENKCLGVFANTMAASLVANHFGTEVISLDNEGMLVI